MHQVLQTFCALQPWESYTMCCINVTCNLEGELKGNGTDNNLPFLIMKSDYHDKNCNPPTALSAQIISFKEISSSTSQTICAQFRVSLLVCYFLHTRIDSRKQLR